MNKSLFTLEKASLLKRFSAYLLDMIMTVIIASGIILLLSLITNFDSHYQKYENRMNELIESYEEEHGISFDISEEQYQALSDEEKQVYIDFDKVLAQDKELVYQYNLIINLTLLMVTGGILVGVLIVEFILPLIFKNGQTLGKKIFGICLVKENCVRITPLMLFIRSFLGKFTIETMIPVYIIIMMIFGSAGIFGVIIMGAILITQIVLLFANKNKCLIHDLMSGTVVVDKSSQMIYYSEEELLAAKKEYSKNEAETKKYF